ncbi:unnamed protein product (macronuclear) [Paramecium tetraurelia]|uniref:Uncharacterized protein n=1 Tax=Paramecium tetraurelia TaxID=5888 RepID=A0BFV3_PARTE|nr:uncharacterized protein GSPATT00028455001 [Paramecium tetraurelia]CAK57420.1 unnamed protein product [Paramecium tetraurelia]|eukprot:XP_001424818.1 hypothetical protein (macronuclear) [Paramecium tetraurelia strain d4-2]
MNNIKQLIEAIQKVEQEFHKLNINPEDRIPIISKMLFNQNLQTLDNLDQVLIAQFQQSGLSELNQYIDYLLYRLDSQCDFELNLNYQTNDKILEEISSYQQQFKEQATQDENEVKKVSRPRISAQR